MNECPDFAESLAAGYAKCGITKPDRGLLLAVSGGVDSMALLHGTRQLWPEETDRIVVAHVNHQLRGTDSRADAEFVEEAAAALDLQFVLLTCEISETARDQGGSIEEAARQCRYELLLETAERMHLSLVVCGHHRNDQAETVLHNILRGTGLKGVAGMAPIRSLSDSVQLVRPMLSVSRSAAEDWLRSQQRPWRDDKSNSSPRFTRNRIRNELLPLLAESYNPQVVESLLRLADHARGADTISSEIAERCLDDVLLELQPGICRIDRSRLERWPTSVVRSALRLIWTRQGWPQQRMTQKHWNSLASSLVTADGTPADIQGVEVSVTRGLVRLFHLSQINSSS